MSEEQTTEPVSVVNADGSLVEKWYEKYGKENEAHLSRYKDFDAIVNSHIATKKKFGKNPDALVEIPTEHSPDEVKAAWAKAHNVPETYEYELSDEMAVKLGSLDEKKMVALREFGKKKNWSQQDFKDVLDFYHNSISEDIDAFGEQTEKQRAEAAEAAKAELRKTDGWRSEEEYKAKVQRAQGILDKYYGREGAAELNLQNSPKFLLFLDNIAETMSEDTLKGVTTPSTVTTANIDSQLTEVYSQIDAIMKAKPANFKGDPKYKELMERKHDLNRQKHEQKKRMSA
jgi:uncharacterized protein YktA (UPF0223 family)